MITEQDIEFFREAKRIQELWEPRFGDWVYLPQSEQIRVITGLDRMGEVRLVEVGTHWLEIKALIFLPRQGQLQEMLEERGHALAHLGDERVPPDFEGRIWNPDEPYIVLAEREPGDYVKGIGPHPLHRFGEGLDRGVKGGTQ